MNTPALSDSATLARVAKAMCRPVFSIWLAALLLLLLTIFTYLPAAGHEFINYDDPFYVTSNAHVQNGLTGENIIWAFSHPVVGNWHPMTMLSHMLDCQMFGLMSRGHHMTSVLLHSINTALIFLWLRRLTGMPGRSWLVAALFGLHPLHVESVAWVAERKDVLSAFFGLLCLMSYTEYAGASAGWNQPSKMETRTRVAYVMALFFFALGLMSKAMLVTVPCILLLLDYWPLNRWQSSRVRELLTEKTPFFLLAAIMSVVTYLVQINDGMMQSMATLTFSDRLANALVSYVRYVGMFFRPDHLCVFYPHPGHWPLMTVLAALFGLLGITGLLLWRQIPSLMVGWLWFLGTLVPVIGLVQVGGQALADRYVYLPSLGLLMLVVWGVCELVRPGRYRFLALSLAGGAAVCVCFFLTRQQLGFWQDNETLYRHALAVTENNFLAHHNLGIALFQKGRIEEAVGQYREAIVVEPGNAVARYDLGTALAVEGQTDDAIVELREAIRLQPDNAQAHENLGTALGRLGSTDAAISEYREAVKLRPDDPGFHYSLGTVLGMIGELDEAIVEFQEAIRLKPDFDRARSNLARARQLKAASAGR